MTIDVKTDDKVVITIQDGKARVLLNNNEIYYPKMLSLEHADGLNTRLDIEGDNNELHNNSWFYGNWIDA